MRSATVTERRSIYAALQSLLSSSLFLSTRHLFQKIMVKMACNMNRSYFWRQWLIFAGIASLSCVVRGADLLQRLRQQDLKIWPMPWGLSHGRQSLAVSPNFLLKIEGNYPDSSKILHHAFARFLNDAGFHDIENASGGGPFLASLPLLEGLCVNVQSSNDTLQFGVDEFYQLKVPDPDYPKYAYLKANTVYGALHGLQTLSQLCAFNFTTKNAFIHLAPWNIIDQPRFPYRGLLIDTSRHFQPVEVIKKVIDAMAYTKLNVLHWHIVDTQSFPLEIPSLPKLWDGAYSTLERYTMDDAREIVRYAQMRGINVLAEIDVPGHARSWGIGYPKLWPSSNCQQPLDVSNEFTFKVINNILSDFSKVFKFKFIHLGGDEVDTGCWSTTPHIKEWLAQKGFTISEAYKFFVLRAQKIAISHGYEPINWEETFNNFHTELNPNTVVHNWLGGGVAPHVVKAGLRCIVSNQDKWYLDHLETSWEDFYSNEPLRNISNPDQQKLVIGGEVCMWGETVDASDIEQTIWPRAAAAAERLWTNPAKLVENPTTVTSRLAYFRCLLNQRGIAAAPLSADGRGTPGGPGSCYSQ